MLHLKMMCLGKNWDPETSKYGERRTVDGAKPPLIPSEFHQLVHKAIQDTQASLQKMFKRKNVEGTLLPLSPDICIVNFYTNSGRLGLHQVLLLPSIKFLMVLQRLAILKHKRNLPILVSLCSSNCDL